VYRDEEWPGETVEDDESYELTRGRFPDDLDGQLFELAKRRLYRRLQNDKHAREVKTSTLAAMVRDLGRLQIAREKPDVDPLAQAKQINVLALVGGLPSERQLEVLRQALQGAEDPEPIREAIKQLEVGDGDQGTKPGG
jgi:hypothetical protein